MRQQVMVCGFLLAFFLGTVGAAFAVSASETKAVQGCLRELGTALLQADGERFEAAVDLERVLDAAVREIAKESQREDTPAPPVLALMFSQAGGNALTRGLLVRESAAFVRYGVTSGAFAGRRPKENARKDAMLAPIFDQVSTGKKVITAIGTVREAAGGGFEVPFTLKDEGNGNSYAVRGRVIRENERFRLVEILNTRELFLRLCREAAAFLE